MTTRLLIDDRNGNVFELPHGSITIKRDRSGRAGSMEFEYYNRDVFEIENGQVIRLEKDEDVIFYGYVFKVAKDKITCYDQVRYLKYKDTKVFENKKASEIVSMIAKENEILTGTITDTKYVIPKQISDGKEYLDMIIQAVESTLLATGRTYFLQDNGGYLELLDIADTKLDIIIDGDSMITNYDYSKNIDSDTYNYILLAQDNKELGKRIVKEPYTDENTLGKWGKLQYYEKVDEGLNEEQINKKGEALLELKNREKKTFKISNAIGNVICKAGYSVYIKIPDEKIEGWYLINSDTHKFNDKAHTMDLELVVY